VAVRGRWVFGGIEDFWCSTGAGGLIAADFAKVDAVADGLPAATPVKALAARLAISKTCPEA
jgi:hypothetical protein